jgi:DNA-binding response OmpR family regulator
MPFVTFTVRRGLGTADKSRLSEAMLEVQVAAMLRVGSLELDLINRSAKRGDRPVDLLPSEFRLLKYMMQRDGQLLTRAKLFQDVRDAD